jgi:hypothetical protein
MGRVRAVACLAGLALVASCNASDATTGPSNALPAGMAVINPVPTDTLVGATLSITFHVTDANGAGLQGALVRWDLVTGVGALSADSARTDASGNAAVDWTLDTTAGTNRMEARTGVLQGLLITVDGTPDRPATVRLHPDPLTFAAVGDTLRLAATVADRFGNTIFSPDLAWSSADTGVATVDTAGRVVSRGAGQTTVTATADTASASAVVVVP